MKKRGKKEARSKRGVVAVAVAVAVAAVGGAVAAVGGRKREELEKEEETFNQGWGSCVFSKNKINYFNF